MNTKIKKSLFCCGGLWMVALSCVSACPLSMEGVLMEIRASYSSAHIADGEISYEKLKLLGIAEEAERILQEWVDVANRKMADLNSDPGVFSGALPGALRDACHGAAEKIYKLYCKTSSETYHQRRIDEIRARIAAAEQKKKDS